MRTILLLSCGLSLGLAATPARADVYREIHGARSEAMGGAHRGLGTSNDAITLNPAGMMLTKRYSIDANYTYSKQDDLHHFSISLVDSKSGPVAGSDEYVFSRGDHDRADKKNAAKWPEPSTCPSHDLPSSRRHTYRRVNPAFG